MKNADGTGTAKTGFRKFMALAVAFMGFAVLVCLGDGTPQDGDILLYLPFDNSMDTVAAVSENAGSTTSGTPAYDDDVYKMHVAERGNPMVAVRNGANAAGLKANKSRITRSITHPYMRSSDFNCATIEFFMKGSSVVDEVTTWGNKFSLGDGTRDGLMIQADDDKKYYVKVQTDTTETFARSPFYMTDGKWHHFAIIIEPVNNGTQTKITWYFDYANKVEVTKNGVWAGLQYNQDLTFGQSGNNVFWFDELRITKGVVGPNKFMRFVTNPDPQDGDTIFYMPLDSDMGSIAEFYGDDIGGGDTTTGTPVYDAGVWKSQVAEYGDQTVLVRKDSNAGCLKTDKTQIVKKLANPFMTSGSVLESATIEFFMKGSPTDADVTTWKTKMSLGRNVVSGKYGLLIQANDSKKYYLRVDTESSNVAATSPFAMTDGKWHHFAVVIEPLSDGAQTQVTYYFDYGDPVVKTATGIWYGLLHGNEITFGETTSALWFDEFRVTKGVLPKSKFMKAKNANGLAIFVR